MLLLASSAIHGSMIVVWLTSLLRDKLHWLDIPERVQYKLCATVHRCLQHKAPQYMIDCCAYTSDISRRQHLRSVGCHQLLVPWHRRSMFGRRAFSVVGPAAWSSLPDYLRDQTRSVDSFRRDLKLFFSRSTSVHSALWALRICAIQIYYWHWHWRYLLIDLLTWLFSCVCEDSMAWWWGSRRPTLVTDGTRQCSLFMQLMLCCVIKFMTCSMLVFLLLLIYPHCLLVIMFAIYKCSVHYILEMILWRDFFIG